MKKSVSLLLVLALLLGLFAGLGVNAYADEPAFAVYTQAGEGEAVLAKAYTAEELATLAEQSEGASYVYYKKDAENAVVAIEYVTLSALLADAGVSFGEGDSLAFTCSDGPYTKGDFSYETLSQRGVDQNGSAVPTAFALTFESGNLTETTVANLAAKAYNSGSIRFVCGMTAAEAAEKSAAGNRMPSGVIAVTVSAPAAEAAPAEVSNADEQEAFVMPAAKVLNPTPVVLPSTQKLSVNGFVVSPAAYNCDGYNYFKIRDLAALLSSTSYQLNVSYDEATNSVVITIGEAYVPIGGELTPVGEAKSVVVSSQGVLLNGQPVSVSAYNIDGYNYFKLRDLGDLLGFGVDYDEATATMLVTTK